MFRYLYTLESGGVEQPDQTFEVSFYDDEQL